MALATPRIRRTAQNTQYTYDLQRRSHDIKTYPILSPQGATILLYGHDNGLTLVWRGGRRLNIAKHNTQSPSATPEVPSEDDGVMILDSDDEKPATKKEAQKPFVDQPEFEEGSCNDPYPEIIQTLDLSLGTAVLHIAVLPMTPTRPTDESAFAGAEVLAEKMVFVVSCATNDVYLVSVPLTPPSHESKARAELRNGLLADMAGSGTWGETVTLLSGQVAPSRGVAIGLVKPKAGDKPGTKTRVIVAAHSREANGTLRLWGPELESVTSKKAVALEPFQTEYLAGPLSAVAFNATHTTQLLTVQPQQGVRIYDFAASPFPWDELDGPFPNQGSWQLSLYAPFAKGFPVRKSIVDAAWIASGRAIFVLLADGTWGIWDVEGASPKSSNLLGKNSSGILGGGVTSFAVTGQIEGTSLLRATDQDGRVPIRGNSVVAPGKLASIQGGITVSPIPGPLGSNLDETVAVWISSCEHICVIPGILRFWDAQLRQKSTGASNLFPGSTPSRMVKIQELNTGLMGERCMGIANIPLNHGSSDKTRDTEVLTSGLPIELAVLGESRLVVVRSSTETTTNASGNLVVRKRFGKRNYASALVVDRTDRSTTLFNLNPGKAGTIRAPKAITAAPKPAEEDPMISAGESFPFMKTLTAAADVGEEDTERDIEEEMLDIMEIDRQLDTLEDSRGGISG